MIRKDYILRQFEELGKVMAVILGLKNNKEWEQMELEINKAILKFTPFTLENITLLNVSEFKNELVAASELKEDQLKFIGDLLYENALLKISMLEEDNAGSLFKKALAVYELYNSHATNNQFNLDVHYKIASIQKLLTA